MNHIHLLVPADSYHRIGKLCQKTETSDPAFVIANALRLYESMIDMSEKGVILTQTQDGVTTPFEPFKSDDEAVMNVK